jgi:hypothetical protein
MGKAASNPCPHLLRGKVGKGVRGSPEPPKKNRQGRRRYGRQKSQKRTQFAKQ